MSTPEVKKRNARREKLYIKHFHQKRKCAVKSCHEFTIVSHIVQKSKFILPLCNSQNELFENFFDSNKDQTSFNLMSFRKALQFQGFCSKHDAELFEEIEKPASLNFDSYRTQLFFCYRPILMERRKQVASIAANADIQREFPKLNNDLVISQIRENFKKSMEMMDKTISRIEAELFEGETVENFSFLHFRLKKNIGICSSVVYDRSFDGRFTLNFFSVLPNGDGTDLIFGYDRNYSEPDCKNYYKEFESFSEEQLLKKVSDILLIHVETWAISYLYEKSIKKSEKIISNYVKQLKKKIFSDRYKYSRPNTIEFDLFEFLEIDQSH